MKKLTKLLSISFWIVILIFCIHIFIFSQNNIKQEKFKMIGQFPVPVRVHSVHLINDRIIIIFAGDKKKKMNSQVYEYIPDSNKWVLKKQAPLALFSAYSPQPVIHDEKIYLFSGRDNDENKAKDFLMYDPGKDEWEIKPSLPFARDAFGVVYTDNKIYCIGGFIEKNKATNAFDVYDLVTGQWKKLPEKPTASGVPSCSLVGDNIICMGGYDRSTVRWLDVMESYNIKTNSWENKNNELSPKFTKRVGHVYDNLYVFHNRGRKLLHTAMYNPIKDVWKEKKPSENARGDSKIFVYKNKIIIIGGWIKRNNVSDKVSLYDPVRDNWQELPSLNVSRWDLKGIIRENMLFVFGGIKTFGQKPAVFDYTAESLDLAKYIHK